MVMPTVVRMVAIVVVLAAWCQAAGAQRVRIMLEADSVTVGEQVDLVIVAEDARRIGDVRIDPPAGVSVVWGGMRDGRSFRTRIVNGRRQQSLTLQRSVPVFADRPGTFDLGRVSVEVDGEAFESDGLRFTAVEPDNKELRLRVQVSDETPFVGEPVEMTVGFSVPQGVSIDADSISFNFAELTSVFDVETSDHVPRNNLGDISVLGVRTPVDRLVERINGRPHTTFSFRLTLKAREAGAMRAGPVSLRARLTDASRWNTHGNPRFRSATANAARLDVRALPSVGRPRTFSGLVGRYAVEAEVDRTSVSVGEPIKLRLRLERGEGSSRVPQPSLGSVEPFRERFRVEALPEERLEQGRRSLFTYQIRPLNGDVEAIPPIEISYFDPVLESYEFARTDAIPLAVESTRVVGLSDGEIGGGVRIRRLGGEALAESLPGPEADAAVALRNDRFVLREQASRAVVVASVVVPPVGAGVSWAFAAVLAARRDGRASAKGARAEALRVLGGDDAGSGRVFVAVATAVGRCTGREPAAMTSEDCIAAAGEASEELGHAVRGLLEDCDAARYSGEGHVTDERLVERARGVVERITAEVRG